MNHSTFKGELPTPPERGARATTFNAPKTTQKWFKPSRPTPTPASRRSAPQEIVVGNAQPILVSE
jgi:hypothetical protein